MNRRGRAIAAILACALAATAAADPDRDAEHALRDAQQRAVAGDPRAIDALETLGAERPATRWTDDAWQAAAQLAERARDFERARRDLQQVIATTHDDQIARRARTNLERLAAVAGPSGEWEQVAAAHDRLATRVRAGGDPVPALRELEALVRAHPAYPRAAMAMVAIARGWEREGDPDRAIGWLRDAAGAARDDLDRTRANAELARVLVRQRDIQGARAVIAQIGDHALAAELRDRLAFAELRRLLAWIALAILLAITVVASIALRRAIGSWRASARRLRRPPPEALYFAPVAAVFAAVARTGNPLVARAVLVIAIAGTATAWFSGCLLEARRTRPGLAALVVHAALAAIAVIAAVYLAIDHDRMLDLVIETWRGGPAMR